jgi:hypothetical protein
MRLQKVLSLTHQFTARYIDDFEQLPYDEDTLRLHLERVLVVSAPIQEIISNAVHIYTWEDPWLTGLCAFVYYFFWSISLMMPFFVRLFNTKTNSKLISYRLGV